jgi:hypothetical protein
MKKKLSEIATGIGIGGAPRMGHPKTNAQRRATHKARYGNTNIPARGMGIKRQMEEGSGGGYIH